MLRSSPETLSPQNTALRNVVLAAVLAFLVPLTAAAASPEPCRDVAPLPLDHRIPGDVAGGAPAFYEVAVARPGLLIVEAHGSSASPAVYLRDGGCEVREENLPLPSIRGRRVQRIEVPGTYFVEVAAQSLAERSFRLDAWLIRDRDREAEPASLKDGGSDDSGGIPPEPVDEWDDLTSPSSPAAGFRFHEWCPLAERPELLATYTCGRQLRLDGSASVVVRPLLVSEIVGVELAGDGWLAVASAGPVTLLDGRGGLVAEVVTAEKLWLPSGSYYLRTSAAGTMGKAAGFAAMRLDAGLE